VEAIVDYLIRVAGYPWWIVVIELFLIGLVVFWVVDFLEGTRGERLFRGVIFVLCAGVLMLNLVGERLGFDRLGYLYKGFLIAVLVVAVAAFQPEIRRVLIRIGQPTFLPAGSRVVTTAGEIAAAAMRLSAARTGAIIVVEGHVALGEFVETGVKMDAGVSSELLESIFYPGGPLHDMAVIIRGDRIIAARVQLPLADAADLKGPDLGSRHRAALGITTGSDALCLVVSEQTGAISLASNGKLARNISESTLSRRLASAIGESAPLAGRFRRFVGKRT
jgi:diadenylate cyclase